MAEVPSGLWKDFIAVQVYGANTGVGKTVFSTLLLSHFQKRAGRTGWNLHYIKPISTGPKDDADQSYVNKYANVPVTTLFQFNEAVSPHVAARNANHVPGDDHVIKKLYLTLKDDARKMAMRQGQLGVSLVETAGGVLSPGPSGTPQADLFRPMRLPVVLVGDHRLGGISSTISAAESLLTRGYDIDAVICFNDGGIYKNSEYLRKYFQDMNIATYEIPWIPQLCGLSAQEETVEMARSYDTQSGEGYMDNVSGRIIDRHTERLSNVNSMAKRTKEAIWHPFTQQKSIKDADEILVFDSAYGDFFQVKHTKNSNRDLPLGEAGNPLLYPAFDASASWWTQGLGHGNPKLAHAAAYAAGRYGHVMFAGATNEPAITLAEHLLKGLRNPRLSKCFFTDDGSTGVEVGIKMALRAACKRYDWDGSTDEIEILGLKGSYHGDTIGAMDASEPCVYNKKVDWYRGKGFWFDYPTVIMRKGMWIVEPPAGMEEDFGPPQSYQSLDRVFDPDNRAHSSRYEAYIRAVLDDLVKSQGRKFGALMMEPIILGAGGMIFVDPLFQRTLVQTIRSYPFCPAPPENVPGSRYGFITSVTDPGNWAGLPVLFDEVFTGLYRLGYFSSASLLQVHPDISVHAKLLTGGLLPLSTTLASDSIYATFLGDTKAEALLHGHSYTAHPIGCHVANVSLQTMNLLSNSHAWGSFKRDWADSSGNEEKRSWTMDGSPASEGIWSMWSKRTVEMLSHHPRVDHVIAIGSVLAVSLKDQTGSGYTSNAAAGLRNALLNEGSSGYGIHCRVLGNVIYFMASMMSKLGHLASVEEVLLSTLDKED